MYPFINIFGKTITTYSLAMIAGAFVAVFLARFLAKKVGINTAEDSTDTLIFAGIGCLVGAKLLYLLVSVDVYWFPDRTLLENLNYWRILLSNGGLVFYGGLIGAFLGAIIYTRYYKMATTDLIEGIMPSIPLFHAFGRVGCFLAGCCHGIEYDGIFSVTFTNSPAAPNGVPLFPVQLAEALLNFILAGILSVMYTKKLRRGTVTATYMISYAIIRFVLEFFRGDLIRGVAILSTSQWISIAMLIVGVALVILSCRKKAEV